jgi:hypothetical protein
MLIKVLEVMLAYSFDCVPKNTGVSPMIAKTF